MEKLNTPKKVTEAFIRSRIEKVEFETSEDTKYTNCIASVEGGFKVVGTAYRQSGTKHKPKLAEIASFNKVLDQLFQYYAFLSHIKHYSYNIEPKFVFSVGDAFYDKEMKDPKFAFYVVSKIRLGHRYYLGLISRVTGDSFSDMVEINKNDNVFGREMFEKITAGEGQDFIKLEK